MSLMLIYNGSGQNRNAHARLLEAAGYISARGVSLVGPEEGYSIDQLQQPDLMIPADCKVALVFGGDGTILAAVRRLAPFGIPVCGVNMGRVGFLSSMESQELYSGLEQLLAGKYEVESRMMIHCRVERGGRIFAEYDAFNDFILRSGELSRAISYSVEINGQPVNNYVADGVIVATPTGSTAYSLSAGGPIVLNSIEMLLITPVCAQSFFARPIVAAADSQVEILCTGERDKPSLTVDGQTRFALQRFDRVLITVSEHKAKTISLREENYFERIKEKLFRKL